MQNESGPNILTARLWREVIERNRFSGLLHMGFIVMAFFFCKGMHLSKPYTLTSYGIIAIGCLYRIYIFKKITTLGIPSRSLEILYHLCLTAIGVGWGLFWYDTHEWYGQFSMHGLFAFLVVSSFVSGAVSANSPRPTGYLCLTISMASVPVYDFLTHGNFESRIIAYCIIFYVCFNAYQLRISYLTIRHFIANDLQINLEREKLQSLINAVPGHVSFIDKELKYIMVNENAKATFGLRNYLGRSIRADNPDSEFVNFVTEFMNGNKRTAVSELKFELNPGKSFSIVSIQKTYEPQGGAVIVAIPMDELIETRQKMKAQEAKAFYTAKLVSLGEMAAGIAHEINNPLAIIMGSSDQIMRNLKRPEPQLDRIAVFNEKIQKTVERISLIIKSLRVLSRNGERDPYITLKLEHILDPSIEISRQRFLEEQIELVITKPENDIFCTGQEIQLSQVIMNLLSNAFDAASDGPLPRWVHLHVKAEKEFVNICIQDSGPGIPKDIKHKIMDPFFTTKAINKGTGLGLSISKSIIEQHGGTLLLDESALNTTFIVRLKQAQT